MTEFELNEARLTAFALGELPENERLDVERWLEESAEARASLAEIQDTIDLVKVELSSEPTPALTPSQRELIEAQLIEAQLAASHAVTTTTNSVATTTSSPVDKGAAQPVTVLIGRTHELVSLSWRWLSVGLTAAALVSIALVLPKQSQSLNSRTLARSDKPANGVQITADSASPESELVQEQLVLLQKSDRQQIAQQKVDFDQKMEREIFSAAILEVPAASPVDNFEATGGGAGGGGAPQAARPQNETAGGQGFGGRGRGAREAMPPAGGRRLNSVASTATEAAKASPAAGPSTDRFSKGDLGGVVPQANAPATATASAPANAGLAAPSESGAAATRTYAAKSKVALFADKKAAGVSDKELTTKPLQPQLALRNDERKKLSDEAPSRLQESLEKRRPVEQAPNSEAYEAVYENEFLVPQDAPLSTFSIDVDSASYANMRRFLTQGQLPPPNAIRVEELINYFSYQYPQPADGQPFSVLADAAPCPWNKEHYVARIGLKARDIDKSKRPPTNLVFLVDVSGSMATANKLPLVKRGLTLLVEEMTENDRISIVTYAGDAGLKLEPTTGNEQGRIMNVIDGLHAGGSTNGAAGINLAYEQALRNFNKDAANRVILCTDGDFNVGISSDDELVKLIQGQAKSGVFLSIFGFGMGNLKDSKLEKLADKGNGHYGYIDDLNEARKVFNEELVGTLYTVAKDVKLQVEFNPLTVGAYRLIGYENRTLAAQDFNDDTKDAGEIGAGHTVTALYEIVPVGKWPLPSNVDGLKYAATDKAAADRKLSEARDAAKKIPADVADDLLTVKLRYKLPDQDTSVKTIDYVIDDIAGKKIISSGDLLWAASVANFGMQLRHSKHAGQWKLEDIAETAGGLVEGDRTGRRSEFVQLVRQAADIRSR